MTYSFTEKKRIRNDFGKRSSILEVPFLLATQLGLVPGLPAGGDVPPHERRNVGLQAAFGSVFPIESYSGDAQLQFLEYRLEDPVFDVKECPGPGSHLRGGARRAPAARPARQGGHEQGTQRAGPPRAGGLHGRDPAHDGLRHPGPSTAPNGSSSPSSTALRACSSSTTRARPIPRGSCCSPPGVIPYRGSWLDFEFDPKDLVYVRIDAAEAPGHRAPAGAGTQGRGQVGPLLQGQRGDTVRLLQDRSLRAEREAGPGPPRAGPLARGDRAVRPRGPGRQRHRGGRAAGELPSRRTARGGAGSRPPVARRARRIRRRQGARPRRGEPGDRGGARPCERGGHPGDAGEAPRAERPPVRRPVRERRGRGPVPLRDPSPGRHQDQPRGAGRDLPHDAPRASRRPRTRRRRCSGTSSPTPSATTSRRSAG